MMSNAQPPTRFKFFVSIILPTLLTINLFVISIFAVIIPAFSETMMDRKREMIRELTQSAWSVLEALHHKEQQGALSRRTAQNMAVSEIRELRYGDERKDYFWITDMQPRMVMHPYRSDLDGKDLSDFKDPHGKRLFVAFTRAVTDKGAGYVRYMWQWKDDPDKIVPKLSYAKGFEPWGWIIGTGIYIEDVKQEIDAIRGKLIKISILISLLIALLLFYVTVQSLKIEKQRARAEADLRESERKYSTLVEAATEGIIMMLENRFAYSNRTLLKMLGYTQEELTALDVYDIFAGGAEENTGLAYFKALVAGRTTPRQFEARLKTKNGFPLQVVLTPSKIAFGGENGFILIAKDISSKKRIEEELDQSKGKYQILRNHIHIGVFRTASGHQGRFMEANPATAKILGCKDTRELLQLNLGRFFQDTEDHKGFMKLLYDKDLAVNRVYHFQRKDKSAAIVSLSAALVRDDKGFVRYCDAIIQDLTEQKRTEQEREEVIAQLQTTLHFLNQPVGRLTAGSLSFEAGVPIQNAVDQMTLDKQSAALVTDPGGRPVGIITECDLREKVVSTGLDPGLPVSEIMSSPLIGISRNAMIFEAMLKMMESGVRHLAVNDETGRAVGTITTESLMENQRYSLVLLIREIHHAHSHDEIHRIDNRAKILIKSLIHSGTKAHHVTRIITTVNDAIVEKLVALAVDEVGPPPAPFAFVALGSEGRREQTLKTDQDNAIIYEDLPEDTAKSAEDYFLALGERVCNWLDAAGYEFCKGEVMAKNPKWCQPLSRWKAYFSHWINEPNPQELLEFTIFFDYRCIYGDTTFETRLRAHLNEQLKDNAPFFLHFAQNVLQYKPPLGFFGKIVVDSAGDNPETFNIKEAMTLIVNFARIYDLYHGIGETNTVERLRKLFEKNVLQRSTYDALLQAYDYLMQIRFKHQAMAMDDQLGPNNYINPRKLSDVDHVMLKKTFSQISNFQAKISYDFTGKA